MNTIYWAENFASEVLPLKQRESGALPDQPTIFNKDMKLHLTFTETDFTNFKEFEKSVKKQLGDNTYIGTDCLCFYFAYPKELVSMLRPLSPYKQLEFDLESSLPDKK